jgi:O-antigen ligase
VWIWSRIAAAIPRSSIALMSGVLAIAVLMVVGVPNTANAVDAPPLGLAVSGVADRSGAVPLEGETLSADVFVFVTPELAGGDIRRVRFVLDDRFFHEEWVAPYDFVGGSVSTAVPWDTTSVSDGEHTIVAHVFFRGGAKEQVSARFTVDNVDAPPVSPPVSPPCPPVSPPVSGPSSAPASPPHGCGGGGGLARFLGEPGGLALTVASAAAVVLGTAVTRRERPLGLLGVADRRSFTSGTATVRSATSVVSRVAATPLSVRILAAGAVVLPLLFSLTTVDAFALPKAIGLIILAVAVVAAALAADRTHKWRVRRDPIELAVLAFLGLNVVAWLLSPDLIHSLVGERYQYQGLLLVCVYAAVFAVGRGAVDENGARQLGIWVTAGSGLVAAYAVVQQLGWDPIWDELYPPGRVFSTFGQPNALAAYLAMTLPVAVAMAYVVRARARILVWGAVALSSAALLFTLSRGAFIAAAAAVALALVLRAHRGFPRALQQNYAVVGLGIVAVALSVVIVPSFRDGSVRAADRIAALGEIADGGSVQMHVDLWRVGTAMALDNPLIGIGPEMFPEEFPVYRDSVLEPDRAAVFMASRPESPHNVYIAIAVGSGIPALALYLGILFGTVAIGVAALRRTVAGRLRTLLLGFTAAIVAHAVTDLFMTAEPVGSWLLWVFMAVVIALARRKPPQRLLSRHPLLEAPF